MPNVDYYVANADNDDEDGKKAQLKKKKSKNM